MSRLAESWQKRGVLARLLWPLAQFYALLMAIRRMLYSKGWKPQGQVSLPVVVVGNLSVGGTGKTPLCAKLVERLVESGWRPAIVSRGYGGMVMNEPHLVVDKDKPEEVGDEPLMLFHQTQVPVCVCRKRQAAVDFVAANTNADIVVSDDGLQHLAMPRAAQIIVIDAHRGFGNEWLLPAGPLRDSLSRLDDADLLAIQIRHEGDITLHESLVTHRNKAHSEAFSANTFYLQPEAAVQLSTGNRYSLDQFKSGTVHAVAGIGNPARFFDALRFQGFDVVEHAMPDHHEFAPEDLYFEDLNPVFVTSKDAVKLKSMQKLPPEIASRVHEITVRVMLNVELDRQLHILEQSLRDYCRS